MLFSLSNCRRLCLATAFFLAITFIGKRGTCGEKPNILFIFADDYAYNCVGVNGNEEVATPTLDALARRGVNFTHAYNMGGWNGAICMASRAMLNTGRFLWRAEKADADMVKVDVQQGHTWSQLMAAAGYETYFTGKWHVRAKPPEIFTRAEHIRGGMPNQTKEGYNRPLGPDDKTWTPWDKKFEGFWKGGKHWSEVVADDAESFFEQAGQSDKPFFMYLAFNAVHDPRQAPKEYVDRYKLEDIALPQPFYPEYPLNIGSNYIRDEKLAPFPRTEYSVKVNRQEYYAIITHMDDQIQRILNALEKSGKADNTYIFFTADHGLACGHHGLLGKQNMYDHSLRVPFFVSGPDIPNGKTLNQRIYLQDVMASTLELADAERPDHVEFQSVLPLIRGEKQQSYESIYGAYTNVQRMVTHGDYKLIVYPQIGKKRLFNLKEDPQELKDLAGDASQATRIQELTSRLQSLQAEMDDNLALDKPLDKSKKHKKNNVKKKAS